MNIPGLKVLPAFIISAAALASNTGTALASVAWSVKISPSGGGEVVWSTSSPAASGTLGSSGKLTFNEGALVDLTFNPKPGYKLVTVMKNLDNWTPYLDSSRHYQFGPVSSPHIITAIYQLDIPVGTWTMGYPDGATSLPAIVDVTGRYTGFTRSRNRPYSADVAMDEDGKIDIMGTLGGYSGPGGGALPHATGILQTTTGGTVARVQTAFEGTRDGKDAKVSASASLPATITQLDPSSSGLTGTGSYRGTVAGTPVSDSNMPWQVAIPADQSDNVKRAWGVTTAFSERVSGKKTAIYCRCDLRLPNGDLIRFPERAVKYKGAAGYTVSFKGGVNVTAVPNRPGGKKTTLSIKNMVLTKSGATWSITGGTMNYAFLGQSGSGPVTSFEIR